MWGAGVPRGSNNCFVFFQHGHLAYHIDGDDEHNRMQVRFHPSVKLVIFGEVRRPILLNFSHRVNFKDFYTKLGMSFNK